MSKKCKECKTPFTPVRSMQSVCGPACAMKVARKVVEKKDKKETKLKLDALQTKPQLVKRAQTAFNAYIRERDRGKNCISCDTPLGSEPNTFDAGHFRSVGSAPHMRFCELNCWAQCKKCNRHLSGNAVEYRKRLLERIGLERLEQIENDNVLRKYTKEALEEIAKHYREEARRLARKRVD